jgi:hypothetical protein
MMDSLILAAGLSTRARASTPLSEAGSTAWTAPRGGAPKNYRPHGQALDHENRKTTISKPAENAQRLNVQAETTRTRLRRSSSCGISWDRSIIAVPLRSNCGAALYRRTSIVRFRAAMITVLVVVDRLRRHRRIGSIEDMSQLLIRAAGRCRPIPGVRSSRARRCKS